MTAAALWPSSVPNSYHLAQLPVNPRVGRMMLFGAMFQCMTPVLIIAASLSFKDPFVIPLHKQKVGHRRGGAEWRGGAGRGGGAACVLL